MTKHTEEDYSIHKLDLNNFSWEKMTCGIFRRRLKLKSLFLHNLGVNTFLTVRLGSPIKVFRQRAQHGRKTDLSPARLGVDV